MYSCVDACKCRRVCLVCCGARTPTDPQGKYEPSPKQGLKLHDASTQAGRIPSDRPCLGCDTAMSWISVSDWTQTTNNSLPPTPTRRCHLNRGVAHVLQHLEPPITWLMAHKTQHQTHRPRHTPLWGGVYTRAQRFSIDRLWGCSVAVDMMQRKRWGGTAQLSSSESSV